MSARDFFWIVNAKITALKAEKEEAEEAQSNACGLSKKELDELAKLMKIGGVEYVS